MLFNAKNKVASAADFAKEAVKLCSSPKYATDTRLNAISKKTDELEQTLTFSIKSDRVVSTLEEVDSVRDNAFSSIGYFLKGASYSLDSAVSEPAKQALSDWEKYGRGITSAKYEDETTYIRSYLGDVSAPKYEAIFKAVPGFKEWIEKLTAAQDAFSAQYGEYVKATAAAKKNASSVKKELVEILNKSLLPYVEAVSYIDEDYKSLAAELAAVLARYK